MCAFGFRCYTTLRWPASEASLAAHQARLRRDAAALDLAFPVSDWGLALAQLAHQKNPCVVRIDLEAALEDGIESYLAHEGPMPARLRLTSRPLPPAATEVAGLFQAPHAINAAQVLDYQREWPQIKHGNLLLPLWQRRAGQQAGFDDYLGLNPEGHLTEASTANVVVITPDGRLLTPHPKRDGCLPGTTLDWLAQHTTLAMETPINRPTLDEAAGIVLANASWGFRPVLHLADRLLPWPETLRQQVADWQTQWLGWASALAPV